MTNLSSSNFFDILHPAEREQTMAELQQAMQCRRSFQSDVRLRLADGSYSWGTLRITALPPNSRPSNGTHSNEKHLSEGVPKGDAQRHGTEAPFDSDGHPRREPPQKQTPYEWGDIFSHAQPEANSQTSLLSEQKFLNAILENLSDGIVACNSEGRLTFFNRATQEFHQLPAEAIPPEQWSDYYDLYLADGVTPMPMEEVPLHRALRGESIRDVEMMIVPKNGQPRTVLVSGDPINSLDGQRLGAVVAMKDISRRKKAEAALQALNAELESRVVERTRELEESYADLEREIETRKQAEQRLIEQNQLLVSQNKELERQRFRIQQQNIQLTEASLMKSRFLATISHELRTPMNAIIGFSQLLLRQRKTPLSPQREEMVRRILSNGKKLLTMVNELLDSSKAEAGKLNIKPQPCNLNIIVTTLADELRSLAIEKKLDFQLNLNLGNPYVVNDPVRFRQVVVNLVSNAIKFTEEGYVRVTVSERHDEGDRIIVRVEDTGIGMDSETMKTIFEPFHQSDQSTTRRYEGTGLGLAIVKSLVSIMGGTITVTSEPGKGSAFCLDIPRNTSEVQHDDL